MDLAHPLLDGCVADLAGDPQLIAAGDAIALGSALIRSGTDIAMRPLTPAMSRHLHLVWGSALPLAEAERLGAALADYYRSQAELVPDLRDVTSRYSSSNMP